VRYKITIEYQGTNFYGWQRQDNLPTIQGEIELALKKLTKQNIEIFASGRTDAGVHALGQVAHFDTKETQPQNSKKLAYSLNFFLRDKPITIIDCQQVDENFHSRFHALQRHYKYQIINRDAPIAVGADLYWRVYGSIDYKLMQNACELFIGQHDFSSFRDAQCQGKNPIRIITKLNLKKDGDCIEVNISAKSFLHHMVRNIVGTLVLLGKGTISIDDLRNIIAAKDRRKSGPNAPAHGLFFVGVDY
jgi:tRNA pseudouridine38-40 synthase